MPRFDPIPSAAPPSSPARRRASGGPRRCALAAAGHPVVLGARRVDRLRGDGGEDPRRRRRGAWPCRSTSPTTSRSTAFAEEADRRARADRGRGVQRRRRAADRPRVGRRPRRVRPPAPGEPARRPARSCTTSVPAMIERRRGDVVFVTSEVRSTPRTHMAALRRLQGTALEGFARAMADGAARAPACGSASSGPGPSTTEQGTTWDRGDDRTRSWPTWSRWGLHAPRRLPAADGVGRRRAGRGVGAPGHPPHAVSRCSPRPGPIERGRP